MEKKANHQANIVRVEEIKEHTNAEKLEIIPIGEYQVVSQKGQFKVGELAVYIQPDSVVPQTEPFKFIWEAYMCVPEAGSTEAFQVPERRRRITVRKFRGEWSEGLLMPLSDFGLTPTRDGNGDSIITVRHLGTNKKYIFKEGSDVSEFIGITHYDPDKESPKSPQSFAPKLRKKYPRSLGGWVKLIKRMLYRLFHKGPLDGKAENISLGIPTYDVDAYKNYPHTFKPGEQVVVTEKIHGSNARYIFLEGVMYAGSRNFWKAPSSNCIFRKNLAVNPWIEEWCRAHEGYVLWGEVTPTQSGFDYGKKDTQFFVFDVRTPEGKWLDKDHDEAGLLSQLMAHSVPLLYQGEFDITKIKELVDGESKVPGAKHIREGVVIKSATERIEHNVGRAQLKVVSNKFLEKDSK